jgi:hypothetical protein
MNLIFAIFIWCVCSVQCHVCIINYGDTLNTINGGISPNERPNPIQQKSEASWTPFNFAVVNDSDSPLDVKWVDFDGKASQYSRLEPGKRFDQKSYIKHTWLLKAANGVEKYFTLGKGRFAKNGTTVKASNIFGESKKIE